VILVGDIGGTNARLGLFEPGAARPSLVTVETYASSEGSLKAHLLAFRARHGLQLEAAAIGIAGPVAAGRVATTNLPWTIEAAELARVLGVRKVVLMNDLEALAWSLGGGIAPQILPWLRRPPFLAAFLAKGRLRPLLEDTPVRVILDTRAGLLGAARRALGR
jgi:glucokinase